MATSGTVAATTYLTQQVIDMAFRWCKMVPEQVTGAQLAVAREHLWLFLTTLNRRGIALWAVQEQLQGLTAGVAAIPLQLGTYDVLTANFRTVQRLTGTATSTSGTAANAFDGDITTTCTLAAPAGTIGLQLTAASPLVNVGILPNVSGTWSYSIQVSNDGVTWTTVLTQTAVTTVAGTWQWFDISGVASTLYMQIVAGASTTLDIRELVFASQQYDVTMSPFDRGSYQQLPNKQFLSRPTQYWYDRQLGQPNLVLWPVPSSAFVVTSLIALTIQRQLQDVGTLSQQIAVPDRWYEPTVLQLANRLRSTIKEVDQQATADVPALAAQLLAEAWDGESDGAPVRLLANIKAYTA